MQHPLRTASACLALLLSLGVLGCYHAGSDSGFGIFGTQVHVQGVARYRDLDTNGVIGPGDELVLGFDGDVLLYTSDPGALALPVAGDSFGAGAVLVAGPASNEVTVVLGTAAFLRTRGMYVAGATSAGSPSGIDVAANLAPGALVNAETGADAEPSPSGALDIVPGFVDGGALVQEVAGTAAVADLDGDGRPDAVTGYADGRFALQLGNGNGFGPAVHYASQSAAAVRAVAFGDVDGDGDLDVVLGTAGASEVWRNDSLGGLAPGSQLGTGAVNDLALADFDCDGVLELAAVGEGPSRFFENDGTGTFTDSGVDLGPGPASALGVADFDRDGDVDLLVGGSATITYWVDTLRENGGFASGGTFGGADTRAIAVGDLDGDGLPDFVAGNDGPNVTWLGTGGSFVAGQVFPDASNEVDLDTRCLVLLDADGDGHVDLVEGVASGARAWWNDGTGHLVLQRAVITDDSPVDFSGGDVDGDGDLDPVVAFAGVPPRETRSSLAGTWGDFGFRDSGQALGTATALSTALADLDGDGDLDLATGGNEAVEVRSNDGIGPQGQPLFGAAPVVLPSPAGRIPAIALVDLDCDGDPDLVAAVLGFGVAVWLNEDGVLAPVLAPFGASPLAGSLAAGDLDSDGDADLVVGIAAAAPDEVLLNMGRDPSGAWLGFARATLLAGAPLATATVTLGDVDGDGDLDLVTGQSALFVPDRLWLGDGTGGFALATATPLGELSPREMAFGDVDQDGDLDLFVASNKANRLWLGDGAGGFPIGDALDFPLADSTAIALVDVDGDGDLDAVVGNGPTLGIQVWINGGLATGEGVAAWTGFDEQPVRLQRVPVESLALGDLDGDGDPDLVSGNGSGVADQVWVNR